MEFYILWLNKIFKKPNDILDLIQNFDVKELFNSRTLPYDFPINIKEQLLSDIIKDYAKREYDYCLNNNIHLVAYNSDSYPINLQNIPQPPLLLYYKGTILPKDECAISIVGSRRYTDYGDLATKKIVSSLATCGITIISGMARGIDSCAHSYAIDNKGRTIAVLGCGVDIVYPPENKKLYDKIIENGAVISELPVNSTPLPRNFPVRNRIVAGLSLGTLVIEAAKKSGSMITARLAGEYGRNIYSIPGNIFNETSGGTNELIKDGARPVTCAEDIIRDVYREINEIVPKNEQLCLFTPTDLSDDELKIYNLLSTEPKSIENIIDKLSLPSTKVLQALTILELKEYIKQLPGQKYIKAI